MITAGSQTTSAPAASPPRNQGFGDSASSVGGSIPAARCDGLCPGACLVGYCGSSQDLGSGRDEPAEAQAEAQTVQADHDLALSAVIPFRTGSRVQWIDRGAW